MIRPALCLAALLLTAPAQAQTPLATQDGVTIAAQTVATGFDQPVYLISPPGDARLFVVEKTGRIHVLEGGRVLPQPFLDLSAMVSTDSEQGLLGLAFHPDHSQNQRFFVFYTDRDGTITVAEGQAGAAALKILLTVPHDLAPNHNGGWLGFGPDGMLYIGTGDGGGSGDKPGNAQNRDRLLGKILRLNVDAPNATAEIFALGLRNPWRAAFDGNRLYIGDVGQGDFEEINVLKTTDAGANLGWNRTEGFACFKPRKCDQTGITPPVHVYDHNLGCSVTGGYVYRGAAMPALQGRYFFSDFCAGTLMSFRLQNGKASDPVGIPDALASLGQVSSFGQDAAGELYVLTFDGTVAKLVPAPN